MTRHYNVVVQNDENGVDVAASLACGIWTNQDQSTIVCESDVDAARCLLSLEETGLWVNERDKEIARRLVAENAA